MNLQQLRTALPARTPGIAGVTAVVIALAATTFLMVRNSEDSETTASEAGASSALAVPVETIGQDSVDGEQPGASWPGEIVSAGDVQIQPTREGTVAEWKVSIGQTVQRGEVIGRMFAPASSPEFTVTLAEASKALAGARAELEAQVAFSDVRKNQLATLKAILEKANGSRMAPRAVDKDVAFRVEAVRDFAAQAVRAIYLPVTNREGEDPIRVYRDNPERFMVTYRAGVGKKSEAARNEFSRDVAALMKGIIRNEDVADQARQFLRSADALVASSADLDGVEKVPGAPDPMGEFAEIVAEQRAEVFEKIADLREARIESAAGEIELSEKLSDFDERSIDVYEQILDVDEQILDVDKELSLARSNMQAAQAAYDTINDAVGTDVSVVAPRSGVVSALFKAAGEYAAPGTALASVNAGADKTIRFRIPGNVTPPVAGELLTAVRPGFARDVKRITIRGVGEALDGNGSRLAEASFDEPVDWPVHASVRVIAGPNQITASPLVSLTAIWFDDQGIDGQGNSNVWLVGDDDRIEAKPVKTGRSLGDKVELIEGGDSGSRIVSVASPALRSGMKLPKVAAAPNDTGERPVSDGHGDHEH